MSQQWGLWQRQPQHSGLCWQWWSRHVCGNDLFPSLDISECIWSSIQLLRKRGRGGAPGWTSQSGLRSVCHGKREAVSHCISFLHHSGSQFTLVQFICYEKRISSWSPCSCPSSHTADCHSGCPVRDFHNQCCFILLISVKKGGKSALHKIAQTQMLKEYLYFS